MPILKRQVDSAPNFVSLFRFMKYNYSIIYFLLAQTIYTLLKRSPFKWKFLALSSARVKFCQISSANFEMRSRFLSTFSIPLPVSWKITRLYFFSSNNIYFAHEEPIKVTILGTFECSGQNLSYSLCPFWNKESFPLQILYPSSSFMKDYSSVLFLAQTIYTLLKRSPLKWKFLRLMSLQVKIFQSSYVKFEMASPIVTKFCIHLQFNEILCTLLAQLIYTLLKRSPLKLNVLRNSRARLKFCQIPYANFETTSRFRSKFCMLFQFHEI